jgi:hypothetical protein
LHALTSSNKKYKSSSLNFATCSHALPHCPARVTQGALRNSSAFFGSIFAPLRPTRAEPGYTKLLGYCDIPNSEIAIYFTTAFRPEASGFVARISDLVLPFGFHPEASGRISNLHAKFILHIFACPPIFAHGNNNYSFHRAHRFQ